MSWFRDFTNILQEIEQKEREAEAEMTPDILWCLRMVGQRSEQPTRHVLVLLDSEIQSHLDMR